MANTFLQVWGGEWDNICKVKEGYTVCYLVKCKFGKEENQYELELSKKFGEDCTLPVIWRMGWLWINHVGMKNPLEVLECEGIWAD